VTFSWTVFFVVVAFAALFIVAYLARRAGPPESDE
jgi:hypothetical protein